MQLVSLFRPSFVRHLWVVLRSQRALVRHAVHVQKSVRKNNRRKIMEVFGIGLPETSFFEEFSLHRADSVIY